MYRGPAGSAIGQNIRLGFFISGKVKESFTNVSVHTVTVVNAESPAELDGWGSGS